MKSIHFGADVLLTGTAIADALVHYAELLARKGSSAAIDVPVRLADGTIRQASFLLGPASQLVAVPESSDLAEIIDEELLARLRHEAAMLENPKPRTNDDSTDEQTLDDLS